MTDRTRVLERLEALVSIETPSGYAPGIAAAQGLVSAWLQPLIGPPRRETVSGVTHLSWAGGTQPDVLLLGHIDTVFPVGTTAQRPFRCGDDRVTGPGVFDMKAGIVIMAEALAQARHPERVAVLLTSDEEVGSLTSRALIEREAVRAGAVLVLEPSLGGAVKVARRGGSIYRLDVHGRAAHAGLDPAEGRNALVELAHQVLGVASFADEQQGTTVSPTVAHAGTATNVIPDAAHLKIDVRAWTVAELERVHAHMHALPAHTPDVEVRVTGGINRPPMEDRCSRELLDIARAVGGRLGHTDLQAVSAGGASDGNFTAALGARTLDGLGPDGSGAHGVDEWVSVPSLLERVELVTGLLNELTRAPLSPAQGGLFSAAATGDE
ncbi:MAG TPA: M20 family metallopeptidase [Microbacterium sp.]|uniref:M20 family metallopeptidase n=1 Tax=Microbacterium sp. TaxID=51671 RepID=UPI002F923141